MKGGAGPQRLQGQLDLALFFFFFFPLNSQIISENEGLWHWKIILFSEFFSTSGSPTVKPCIRPLSVSAHSKMRTIMKSVYTIVGAKLCFFTIETTIIQASYCKAFVVCYKSYEATALLTWREAADLHSILLLKRWRLSAFWTGFCFSLSSSYMHNLFYAIKTVSKAE